jgi:hypothetical protein
VPRKMFSIPRRGSFLPEDCLELEKPPLKWTGENPKITTTKITQRNERMHVQFSLKEQFRNLVIKLTRL